VKELKTQPVMKFIENYRSDWKNHVLWIPHSRIPSQILHYQQKRIKTFGETLQALVWDHNRPLGLRHGKLMMMYFIYFVRYVSKFSSLELLVVFLCFKFWMLLCNPYILWFVIITFSWTQKRLKTAG
jgi:hypothetical protein